MKKSLKNKIPLPDYTLGEEITNSITHGIGTMLSITALVLCIIRSAIHRDAWAVVSSAIYGSTLVVLYLMSTIYHSLARNKAKRVFRIIDHCSIFLLIAGTYTPYTLLSIRGPLGWSIFGLIWGMAIAGIVFNAIDLEKFSKISFICYLVMGWAVVMAIKPIIAAVAKGGLILLLAGGIAYSLGAVFYALGAKKKYIHSVWHVFVIIGSVLHFFSVFFYVI